MPGVEINDLYILHPFFFKKYNYESLSKVVYVSPSYFLLTNYVSPSYFLHFKL